MRHVFLLLAVAVLTQACPLSHPSTGPEADGAVPVDVPPDMDVGLDARPDRPADTGYPDAGPDRVADTGVPDDGVPVDVVTPCDASLTRCGGVCVDLGSAHDHCGRCGQACAARQVCTTGRCACVAGAGDCDGIATNGCETDLATSTAHCGRCAMACATRANATATCVGGACTLRCDTGFGDCDGMEPTGCETSLQTTLAHCGACGRACPMRAHATATCTGGTCGFTCVAGYGDCDGAVDNGCESALNRPDACGACGVTCPGGDCSTGTCACPGGGCFASFISPGTDAMAPTWPRDVGYTLDAPGAATILYTLDGTTPGAGTSTMSGPAPVVLPAVATGTTIRWVAQFAVGGREPVVHELRHTGTGASSSLGAIPEMVDLNGEGPVLAVAPRATVRGSLRLQHWRSDPTGYCPGCVIQSSLGVDGVGQVECHFMGSTAFPGTMMTYTFTFTAPASPGRYFLRHELPLDYACGTHAGGGAIGVIYVR
jgi:hypothetical protein